MGQGVEVVVGGGLELVVGAGGGAVEWEYWVLGERMRATMRIIRSSSKVGLFVGSWLFTCAEEEEEEEEEEGRVGWK